MRQNALKVLVLGTSTGSEDALKYLKAQGHTVYITDNEPDKSHPAKELADETFDVSTQEVGALVELVKKRQVEAVFAGINEANIKSAIAVSEALGLPYFCTREQWDTLMDKEQFRDLSKTVGLPSPQTFYAGSAEEFVASDTSVVFPCIVKPVDNSALRGITVCYEPTHLEEAVAEAERSSSKGHVIIEELLQGNEFTAAYVVVNGKASLSSVDDRLPLWLDGQTTSFPAIRVYPGLSTKEIQDACNEPVQRLCDAVGLQNCCLFVQGVETDGRVAVFEAGLRLAAESPYRFLEHVNGVNQLHHMVDSSIGRAGDHDAEAEDPYLGGKVCSIVSFVGSGGQVSKIVGLREAVESLPQILSYELRYDVGQRIASDGSLRQLVLRFILEADDREDLVNVVGTLNNTVDILDADGNSLVKKMSEDRIVS